jgi:hypothetical protein
MKLKFCLLTLHGLAISVILISPAIAQSTTFIRNSASVTTINTNAVRQVNIINVNGLVPYQNNAIVPYSNNITNTSINNFGNNLGSNNLGISGDRIYTNIIPIGQSNTIINRTIIHPNTYSNTSTTTTVGGFVTNEYGRINSGEQTNIYNSNYGFNGNGLSPNPSFSQNPNSVTIINVIPSNNVVNTSNGFCVNGICTSNSVQDSSRRSLILLNDYNRYGSSYRIR